LVETKEDFIKELEKRLFTEDQINEFVSESKFS